MSKNYKKKSKASNYFEFFLGFFTRFLWLSAFVSFVGIPVGIRGSARGLRTYAITAKNISQLSRKIRRSMIK